MMYNEYDEYIKAPIFELGEIKSNISSCTIKIISYKDKFIYGINIKYMNESKEKYKIGLIGRTLTYDISHRNNCKSYIMQYPIDPLISKDEIVITSTIIPYINMRNGDIESSKLELKEDVISHFNVPLLEFS